MDSITTRRPCFTEKDNGLASIAHTEAGFSGNHQHQHQHQPNFFSRLLYYTTLKRRGGLRNISFSSPASSPRCGRFYYDTISCRFEEQRKQQPHFLATCSLCKKPLGDNKDIFMYRGDTPFCSVECRQEQIDIDEAKEKNYVSASMTPSRKKQKKSNSTTPNNTQDYPFHAGKVAAA